MSIVRMLYVKVNPETAAEAERIWKQECAPLMIQQPGCLSEKLLKCHDEAGEYISYSEWEDAAAIETYRKSKDHDVVVSHSRNLQGAKASAKTYEVTG
ncbi:MAG: antibiotic biosynthesis monooxygenase family protein [Alphaproteobacteria bacterium]